MLSSDPNESPPLRGCWGALLGAGCEEEEEEGGASMGWTHWDSDDEEGAGGGGRGVARDRDPAGVEIEDRRNEFCAARSELAASKVVTRQRR
mmetsp:Transcript_31926/g.45964  ORF Transcript_31926/g.45964 Transcript_31926/m.45964 type:complete len:92 (+) Transcript_31926:525-800(+)